MTEQVVKATLADLRVAGICKRAGPWMEARGLSWRTFIRDGLPAEAFEATGDPRAIRLAAIARARAANGS